LNKSQLCLLIVHIALVQSIGENYPMSQTAYFATGCFWGAERRLWNLDGVIQTSVGYMGGNKPDPTYKEVCTGTTNHAEIVEVIFDPQLISYKRLLAEFWVMHDPTSLNQQGGDIGTQYRSAIFITSAEQMQQVLESKEIYQGELSKNEIGRIVTQILPAAGVTYWLAEEYHQRYLEKNPNGYDCHSSTGVAFPSALMSNNG
jgi:peptide-methionine (S)-S-oxide reductase